MVNVKQLPIYFDPITRERLDRISNDLKIARSATIRMVLNEYYNAKYKGE